ncbi:transposable element Tcb1 transposase [Trichonephila clavipes]|nr:transposable element Tcb1 transposase [Trichonephila clavipes]
MKDSSKREQDFTCEMGASNIARPKRSVVYEGKVTNRASTLLRSCPVCRVPKNDLALRDYMRLTSSLRILSLGTEMPRFNLVCLGPPSLTSLSLEVIEVTDGCRGENRRATVKQHTTQMNQGATNSVFQTTVQRSLLRLVLRSRRLVHAPMLTAVHQQRRLEFSYRYRNWASNERRQDGGIYQQDIAECHTTDSVRVWFKEHQDQFIVLPCPENSPDLSPINNLWNPLDRVVRVMDPHARNLVQQ